MKYLTKTDSIHQCSVSIPNEYQIDISFRYYDGKIVPIVKDKRDRTENNLSKARRSALWIYNKINGSKFPRRCNIVIEYDYKTKLLRLMKTQGEWIFAPDKGSRVHCLEGNRNVSYWNDICKTSGVFYNSLFPPRKKGFDELMSRSILNTLRRY